MDRDLAQAYTTSQIDSSRTSLTIDRQAAGECIVFLARTRNAEEVAELDEWFHELRTGCRVRILARGPVVASVVKLTADPDGRQAAEMMSLFESLSTRYPWVKVDLGLHPTLNRLIEDMALDAGSELHPCPHCSLCGRPEPFPTRLRLDSPGCKPAVGRYCASCLARFETGSEQALVDAVVRTDQKTFNRSEPLELSPQPAKRGTRTRYSVLGPRSATAF